MPSVATTEPHQLVPLCVDLDGTLIYTDLLWESLVQLLKHKPLSFLLVPFWWARGRAYLKAQLAARVSLEPASLPYNEPLLRFLREEQRRGRPIYLVTASDSLLARPVADHLRLFNEVLASDGVTNLRGKNKGARLSQRFGGRGFDYAGNSTVDLPVWEQSRQAIVVNGSRSLAARAAQLAPVNRVFESQTSIVWSLVRALRPHQWIKNLIIFVPLLTSHKIMQWHSAMEAIEAFIAFCLCASGVYVLNDLLDVNSDRHHPGKRLRPFASGEMPLYAGLALFPVLLAAGAALGWWVSPTLAAVLGVYLILSTSYSWRLKQVPLVDVFCLAALYTIRLIAGHVASAIVYSFWLLVFSMFIFLSLALVKRFLELGAAREQNKSEIKGRGYLASDAQPVATLGASSGYLAVLVLALYVNSPEVRLLYIRPTLLLLVCPVLMYWISRVWLLAYRGELHDDPVVFALKDPVSYLAGAVTLILLWLATGR